MTLRILTPLTHHKGSALQCGLITWHLDMHCWLIWDLSPGRVINYRSRRSHVMESHSCLDAQDSWLCWVVSLATVWGVIKFTAAAADVPVSLRCQVMSGTVITPASLGDSWLSLRVNDAPHSLLLCFLSQLPPFIHVVTQRQMCSVMQFRMVKH